MLEATRDNGGFSTFQAISNLPTNLPTSSKNKAKGVFTTFDQSDPESEDEVSTSTHVVAGHSDWIKLGSQYKFPCPLQSHDHEIAACLEFLTITPKDCWVKIPRGRICYTCLKPKGPNGVCKTRRCNKEKTIPQVLLCAACTQWAAAKGWASFSILMINLVMQLTLITRYFLSLIYQFGLVLVPLPLTLSSALNLILPRLPLSLKYRSTCFILCSG